MDHNVKFDDVHLSAGYIRPYLEYVVWYRLAGKSQFTLTPISSTNFQFFTQHFFFTLSSNRRNIVANTTHDNSTAGAKL